MARRSCAVCTDTTASGDPDPPAATATATAAWELPEVLVAVSVYVVVAAGETTLLARPVTLPTPESIASAVAPLTLQESVVIWPGWISAGEPVKDEMTGASPGPATVAPLQDPSARAQGKSQVILEFFTKPP